MVGFLRVRFCLFGGCLFCDNICFRVGLAAWRGRRGSCGVRGPRVRFLRPGIAGRGRVEGAWLARELAKGVADRVRSGMALEPGRGLASTCFISLVTCFSKLNAFGSILLHS